jgi:signal transduction histidine kinase
VGFGTVCCFQYFGNEAFEANQGSGRTIMAAGSRRIFSFHRLLQGTILAGTFSPLAGSANAQTILDKPLVWLTNAQPVETAALGAGAVALLAIGVAMIRSRRFHRKVEGKISAIEDLEARLNTAETLLSSEPHLLFIWHGGSETPDSVSGDMHGMCALPEENGQLGNFISWLDAQSVDILESGLEQLKSDGEAFNFGVRTRQGDLLEADGRTAGGMATLRLRPLAGEREDTTKLSHDREILKRQVLQLSTILDSAPMPIWLRSGDRKLVWVNRAYVGAVEADDVAAVVSGNVEITPAVPTSKTNGEENSSEHQSVPMVANGKPHRAHTVITGQKKALDLVEVTVENGTAGFAIDVSALEDTEKELERHIRAHASTLDNLKTAVAIFGPDQRLRFFNTAYAELWQLEPDWLDTRPSDGEILDKLRELRRLPEQANWRDWKSKQLENYSRIETREDWWYLPDEQTLRVISEQHPFGGVTYLYENVTERIALESRYNELARVQGETLDNLHEGLAHFGSDGRLKLSNPAFARFWQLETEFLKSDPHVDEVITHCKQLLDDQDIWDSIKYAVTSLDGERTVSKQQINRPDGQVFDFTIAPLPDGNTLISYVDVTDSSRIERALRERTEALEAADKLKTNFLSNVSYELRTPLTSINGFAEALEMGIAGELREKQSEYVKDIQSSSSQLLSVIDAILDLASIDAGAMKLNLEQINVRTFLAEIAGLVKDRVKKSDLTLEIQIPEKLGPITGDSQRLKQVLYNLLLNAIGYSADGKKVVMGCRIVDDNIEFWVSDFGQGMDEATKNSAFDRFTAKPSGGGHRGAGLGLSIVKSFVELHDGSISLHSEMGKGTTVLMQLPVGGPAALDDGTAMPQPESARLVAG